MSPVIVLAVLASVLVNSQLVSSVPTGDPILIGKPRVDQRASERPLHTTGRDPATIILL